MGIWLTHGLTELAQRRRRKKFGASPVLLDCVLRRLRFGNPVSRTHGRAPLLVSLNKVFGVARM